MITINLIDPAESRRLRKKDYDRKRHARNPSVKNDRAKAWAEANPEKVRESRRGYRERNAEVLRTSGRIRAAEMRSTVDGMKKVRAANAKWRAKKGRAYYLKKLYGISLEQFRSMLQEQNFRCLVCVKFLTEKTAVVDHVHPDGPVRGLLCDRCNIALGCFKDDPETMERAARYVRERGVS